MVKKTAKPKTALQRFKTIAQGLQKLRKNKESLGKDHEHRSIQKRREKLLAVRSALESQGLLPVKQASEHLLPMYLHRANFAI
jgi:hypothetical protein